MPVTEPVLCKRIPTAPWGDPKDRQIVGYDEFVKTEGYETLRAALDMTNSSQETNRREQGRRGRGSRYHDPSANDHRGN